MSTEIVSHQLESVNAQVILDEEMRNHVCDPLPPVKLIGGSCLPQISLAWSPKVWSSFVLCLVDWNLGERAFSMMETGESGTDYKTGSEVYPPTLRPLLAAAKRWGPDGWGIGHLISDVHTESHCSIEGRRCRRCRCRCRCHVNIKRMYVHMGSTLWWWSTALCVKNTIEQWNLP